MQGTCQSPGRYGLLWTPGWPCVFKPPEKLSTERFSSTGFFFETFQARTAHCMHPGLLAVQPHRSMATLSVEGESGLVRGEASVPERLARRGQRRHGPWSHGLRDESDQACSIINSSPKSDLGVSACFGGRGGCNLRCVLTTVRSCSPKSVVSSLKSQQVCIVFISCV